MGLRVLDPGWRTTIQDLGRPGYAALGVSPSGAADRAALRLANRLLGNPETEAALECTLGGLVLQADSSHWCALTGAIADVLLDGACVPVGMPFFAAPGSTIAIGRARVGLRCYLAVAGGLTSPLVLGSRSEDTLGGVLSLPVTPGAVLPVGIPHPWLPRLDHPHNSPLPQSDPLILPVTPGPRRDWITDASWGELIAAEFAVSDRLDRIGVRLTGPALQRAITGELPSEGLIRGAVQVPPSGDPLVFLADHPTTGGYPVVAVVADEATDLLAQVRPGHRIRFRPN
jgi:biotin-dependent carboxylase-like uncharacterized protein